MTEALIPLACLALSLGAFTVAARALGRARRRMSAGPEAFPAPPVSIVKPLAGLDEELEQNLESFFRLDYPEYEIVFSFASEGDPAFPVARRVADRHPGVPSVFVVDGRETGRNSKVNRLAAGLRRARFPLLLFSDGDVRVAPGSLREAVRWFADPSVGLVSSLFRATGAASLGARLEALYLNGVLRPATAAIAGPLGRPCVVGKSILLSRAALNAIGGLGPLRDFLAEDFLLGERVARARYRVVLSTEEVEVVEGSKSLAAVWTRHRRWAILRRRLGGPAYAVEILASPALPFAAAVLLSDGSPGVVAVASLLWAARLGLEAAAAYRAGERLAPPDLLLLPARDVGVALLFWAGLLGRRTRWRGRALRVGPGTLLEAEIAPGARAAAAHSTG